MTKKTITIETAEPSGLVFTDSGEYKKKNHSHPIDG